MYIGNKIKELRKRRGITQEQLAQSIGISFQAVSKWENHIALPDITLAPTLARYFGVSMDELFGFDVKEIRAEALAIAEQTVPLRETDPEEGKRILEEGLKTYPDNDILLQNLLYVINYTKTPDETIRIALKVLEVTNDNSIKYDALRFLAYAYKAKGDTESACAALEQVPELYFSRLSEMAYILEGAKKREAAEKQKSVSFSILLEMQSRIAECHLEARELSRALEEYERAVRLLDLFEATGEQWDVYRRYFEKQIEGIKEQVG